MHGNIKNKNAAKKERADEFIHLRVSPEKKATIVHASQKAELKLTRYILDAIDEKIQREN